MNHLIQNQLHQLRKANNPIREAIRKVIKILKYPMQDRFLYRVSQCKWKDAQNNQMEIFSGRENYTFCQLAKSKSSQESLSILFENSIEFLNSYDRQGYPFEALFKTFVPQGARVLQIAVGACPELLDMRKRHNFYYYVEDPLFPKIMRVVDLKTVLHDHIEGFCASPAETMWREFPEFFDTIVCHNVLNHTYDPAAVINSCYRMLKSGGHIFDLTLRQPVGPSHPGLIGHKALIRGYTKRGFEQIYNAVFKHLDYSSFPKKERYYSVWRKKLK